MLYLFGTGSFRNELKAVKVGYTANKEERETAYLLHNPFGEFLCWRDGDRKLELKLHLRLKDFKMDILDEWFYYEDPVLGIFCHREDDIDSWLWENRTDVFFSGFLPNPGTLKREIYNDLYEKYTGQKAYVPGIKAVSEYEDYRSISD